MSRLAALMARSRPAFGWAGRAARLSVVLTVSVALGVGLAAGHERTVGDRGPRLPASQEQLLSLLNGVRARTSCPRLTADVALDSMAQAQADDMVARGFLSSVNPDGQDAPSRARWFGYFGNVSESFAAGLDAPTEVVSQWTNPWNPSAAPVVRRIQSCKMVSIGIGHNTGTVRPPLAAQVWVIVLGDR
jgi:uncharacterized protein YkwD